MESMLTGKKIFLTGGTGFFGKCLLDFFMSQPLEVVVLSRNPFSFLQENPQYTTIDHFSFIEGDVRDFVFPDGTFDYVIHAATPISSDQLDIDSPEMYSIIVDGTKRVIKFARQANVERLLYVSSGAVYGKQPSDLTHIPEAHPCSPINAYGHGKLASEKLCFQSEIPSIAARCFAFVGPHLPLNAHFAIGNFIGNCLRNEPIVINGDGTPLRSYMYESDLVEWLLTIMLKGTSGEAYNIGSEVDISIAELAEFVRCCAGTKNSISILQKVDINLPPVRYIPSIQKAEEELELVLKTNLKHAVVSTLAWYKKYN
jgi:nucleoside-diphosphate-sugar epimerase